VDYEDQSFSIEQRKCGMSHLLLDNENHRDTNWPRYLYDENGMGLTFYIIFRRGKRLDDLPSLEYWQAISGHLWERSIQGLNLKPLDKAQWEHPLLM